MKLGLCAAAALSVALAGCLLNGGDCPSGFVVVVDGGADALPSYGQPSAQAKCNAICGTTYHFCKVKDPTHVQCVPPCE